MNRSSTSFIEDYGHSIVLKVKLHLFGIFKNSCIADLTGFCTADCLFFIVFGYYHLNKFGDANIYFTANDEY